MKKIILFCFNHPVSILMLTVILVLSTAISLIKIKSDFLPKIEDNTIYIITAFPDLPADQVEQIITIPVENTVSSVKSIKNISSVSRTGLSCVTVIFNYGCNIDSILFEIRQLTDQLYTLLPQGCSKPTSYIYNQKTNNEYLLSITKQNINTQQLTGFYKKEFLPTINRTNLFSQISITGLEEMEINILYDADRLTGYKLTPFDIMQAINNTNTQSPAGRIYENNCEFYLNSSSLYKNIENINNTFIPTKSSPVKLSNLCSIELIPEIQKNFAIYDSKECVIIKLIKKTDVSPVEASAQLNSMINEWNNSNSRRFQINLIKDPSIELVNTLKLLIINIILGTIFTALIVQLFFKSIHISIITATIVPLCIVSSVAVLYFVDKTINLFSVTGIAVFIGMVVDCSLVNIESILIKNKIANTDTPAISSTLKKKSGKKDALSHINIMAEQINAVSKSNFGSSITTIIVFYPLIFLPGIMGQVFRDFCISLISGIFFSYLLSFTYIPALISIFKTKIRTISSNALLDKFIIKYKTFFNNRSTCKFTINVLIFTFFTGILAFLLLPKNLSGDNNNKQIYTLCFNNNYSLQKIKQECFEINTLIKENDNKTDILFTAGLCRDNIEKINDCIYTDKSVEVIFFTEYDSEYFENILKEKGILYTTKTETSIFNDIFKTNTAGILKFNAREELEKFVNTSSKLYFPNDKIFQTVFNVDLNKCSFYGVSPKNISETQQALINGLYCSSFIDQDEQIPIKIMYNKPLSIQQIMSKQIYYSLIDKSLPLNCLGTFSTIKSDQTYFRYNKKPALLSQNIVEPISDNIECINTKSTEISYLYQQCFIIIVSTIAILYCIIGAQFESFLLPILLLLSLIPCITGALLSLFITRQSLNINSLMGLIALCGICINPAILMYENSKTNCNSDLVSNCAEKLPAIIVTTITSLSGLLPFVFSYKGINTQTSLTITLTGGLITSCFIQIFVVPGLLSVLKRDKK